MRVQIYQGGVMALVPQQLTNLRQSCAGAKKLGGEAVPEDMGAFVPPPSSCNVALESRAVPHKTRAGVQLSGELGLDYAETRSGARIEGIYRQSIDLTSGRFAVIEKSREFTLAPWRPVLERSRGKQGSGIVRDETVSWTLGRQRGGPSIS